MSLTLLFNQAVSLPAFTRATADLKPVVLLTQMRGDEFSYSASLAGGWQSSMFTSLKFTLRDAIPESSVVDDTGAIDQASVATGEIVFSDATNFTVTIPGSRTTAWPKTKLHWDFQGVIIGLPSRVFTLAFGEITVRGDVTRSQ
jgi:hypothetical protein